jgi:hypothetical protein
VFAFAHDRAREEKKRWDDLKRHPVVIFEPGAMVTALSDHADALEKLKERLKGNGMSLKSKIACPQFESPP